MRGRKLQQSMMCQHGWHDVLKWMLFSVLLLVGTGQAWADGEDSENTLRVWSKEDKHFDLNGDFNMEYQFVYFNDCGWDSWVSGDVYVYLDDIEVARLPGYSKTEAKSQNGEKTYHGLNYDVKIKYGESYKSGDEYWSKVKIYFTRINLPQGKEVKVKFGCYYNPNTNSDVWKTATSHSIYMPKITKSYSTFGTITRIGPNLLNFNGELTCAANSGWDFERSYKITDWNYNQIGEIQKCSGKLETVNDLVTYDSNCEGRRLVSSFKVSKGEDYVFTGSWGNSYLRHYPRAIDASLHSEPSGVVLKWAGDGDDNVGQLMCDGKWVVTFRAVGDTEWKYITEVGGINAGNYKMPQQYELTDETFDSKTGDYRVSFVPEVWKGENPYADDLSSVIGTYDLHLAFVRPTTPELIEDERGVVLKWMCYGIDNTKFSHDGRWMICYRKSEEGSQWEKLAEVAVGKDAQSEEVWEYTVKPDEVLDEQEQGMYRVSFVPYSFVSEDLDEMCIPQLSQYVATYNINGDIADDEPNYFDTEGSNKFKFDGMVPGENTKMVAHVRLNKIAEGKNIIFQAHSASADASHTGAYVYIDDVDRSFHFGYTGKDYKSPANLAEVDQDYYITLSKGHFRIDTVADATHDIYHQNFPVYPLHEIHGNVCLGGDENTDDATTDMNIYSFMVYENDELAYNLIPAIVSGGSAMPSRGLYDLVRGEYRSPVRISFAGRVSLCADDQHPAYQLVDANNVPSRQCIICGTTEKIEGLKPYIRFNGRDYFDTGYTPNQNTEIRMHFIYHSPVKRTSATEDDFHAVRSNLFGNMGKTYDPKNPDGGKAFMLFCGQKDAEDTNEDSKKVYIRAGKNTDVTEAFTLGFADNQEYTLSMTASSLKVVQGTENGNVLIDFKKNTPMNFSAGHTLTVGDAWDDANSGIHGLGVKMELFSFDIYEKGKLLHSFVPDNGLDKNGVSKYGYSDLQDDSEEFFHPMLGGVQSNPTAPFDKDVSKYLPCDHFSIGHAIQEVDGEYVRECDMCGQMYHAESYIYFGERNYFTTDFYPTNKSELRLHFKPLGGTPVQGMLFMTKSVMGEYWGVDVNRDRLCFHNGLKDFIADKVLEGKMEYYLSIDEHKLTISDRIDMDNHYIELAAESSSPYVSKNPLAINGSASYSYGIENRVFSLDLFESGIPVRHYIPAKKAEKYGFFETVTQTFHSFSNNNSFVNECENHVYVDYKLKDDGSWMKQCRVCGKEMDLTYEEKSGASFVRTNGYSYFDTDYKPQNHTKIVTHLKVTDFDVESEGIGFDDELLYGAERGDANMSLFLKKDRRGRYYFQPGGESSIKVYAELDKEYYITQTADSLIVYAGKNGTVKVDAVALLNSGQHVNVNKSLFIGQHSASVNERNRRCANEHIYSFDIYENDKLQCRFLPSRCEGAVQMYEVVKGDLVPMQTFDPNNETPTMNDVSKSTAYVPNCRNDHHKYVKVVEKDGKYIKHCLLCDKEFHANSIKVVNKGALSAIQPEEKDYTLYLDMAEGTEVISYLGETYPELSASNQIFEMAVLREGALIHDYLPSTYDEEHPGLYDVVTGTFYSIEDAEVDVDKDECLHAYCSVDRENGTLKKHCYICGSKFTAGNYFYVKYDGGEKGRGTMTNQYIDEEMVAEGETKLHANTYTHDTKTFINWQLTASGKDPLTLENGQVVDKALFDQLHSYLEAGNDVLTLNAQWDFTFSYNGKIYPIKDDYTQKIDIVDDGFNGFSSENSFTGKSWTYTRPINTATVYGTLCLPFVVSAEENPEIDLFNVLKVEEKGGTEYITLTPVSRVDAGQPFIFKLKEESETLTVRHEGAENIPMKGGTNAGGNVVMKGTFGHFAQAVGTDSPDYYAISGDHFIHVQSTIAVKPYHAYITREVQPAAVQRMYFCFDEETTGIVHSVTGEAKAQYYNLSGVRVAQPQKGVNIVKTNKGEVKKVLMK